MKSNYSVNRSRNFTSLTNITKLQNTSARKYIFLPIPTSFTIFLVVLATLMFVLGFAGSSFALVYKKKELRRNRMTRLQNTLRRTATAYLIISLSASDILTAILGPLVFIVSVLFHVSQTSWPCKLLRSILSFLVLLSVNNIFLISVEQFLAIFYPTRILSSSLIKRTIFFSWVAACLTSLSSFLTFDSIQINLDTYSYTLVCQYKPLSPSAQFLIVLCSLVFYFLPLLFMSYSAIVISKYIRKKVKEDAIRYRCFKKKQFKTARIFVNIIVCFVLPYTLVFLYGISSRFWQVSFATDYLLRNIGVIVTLSNCVINPAIFFTRLRDFRRMVHQLAKRFMCYCQYGYKVNPTPVTHVMQVTQVTQVTPIVIALYSLHRHENGTAFPS